ncbi:EfeM/EfeO family lipoprotein [Streptomyces sp. NPDC049577]|uniref:EfeM/EfeO family lipoprotein n=1 Tax=Streptomyces sp. NPDC049577 TaxID=3155153 RepID=UPI00341D8C0C
MLRTSTLLAATVLTAGTPTTVETSPGNCGTGWTHPHPGLQRIAVRNTATTPAEVRLQDAGAAVLAETEPLAPGTIRVLRARLGAGSYAFVCLHEDADAVTGPTVRITGPGRTGPAAVPVSRHDLIPAALAEQAWTARRLDELVARTGALRTAVDAGDRSAARTAWLSAHLGYARLGAAYDAFEALDGPGEPAAALDRTTAGLPGGVHDPRFTGFHRVEYGLWHGEDGTALRRATARLAADARRLRDAWALARLDPADLARRVHEITEDTLRGELTGRTDYGSGTGLATARARLDATRRLVDRLRPLLRTRYPGLAALDDRLARTRRTLEIHLRSGTWTPLARLGRADRERIDARFGDLAERLADVAAVCGVRRTV